MLSTIRSNCTTGKCVSTETEMFFSLYVSGEGVINSTLKYFIQYISRGLREELQQTETGRVCNVTKQFEETAALESSLYFFFSQSKEQQQEDL